MDGTPSDFSRKLGRELMMLTQKKVTGLNKEDDNKLLESCITSDEESEIIYYSE
jgi:hypothetical protein